MKIHRHFGVVALIFLAASAHAQGTLQPSFLSAEERAALMRRNREIVANTPGADGVLLVREDGVKHLQSGLICPPFPNVTLSRTNIFPSAQPGESVSCDYSRTDKAGKVASTLSIAVAKAGPDATVQSAFAKYQRDLAESFQSIAPVSVIADVSPSAQSAGLHAEKFFGMHDGRETTAELRVAMGLGWIVQVRAVYVGEPGKPGIAIVKPGQTPEEALPAGMDREQMSDAAMWVATHTIGH